MTQTQKFMKRIPEAKGYISLPKAKVARRVKQRGAEYQAHMDALSAAHEQKRVRLLKARQERERAEAEAAKKAAKKAAN